MCKLKKLNGESVVLHSTQITATVNTGEAKMKYEIYQRLYS